MVRGGDPRTGRCGGDLPPGLSASERVGARPGRGFPSGGTWTWDFLGRFPFKTRKQDATCRFPIKTTKKNKKCILQKGAWCFLGDSSLICWSKWSRARAIGLNFRETKKQRLGKEGRGEVSRFALPMRRKGDLTGVGDACDPQTCNDQVAFKHTSVHAFVYINPCHDPLLC